MHAVSRNLLRNHCSTNWQQDYCNQVRRSLIVCTLLVVHHSTICVWSEFAIWPYIIGSQPSRYLQCSAIHQLLSCHPVTRKYGWRCLLSTLFLN